MTTFKDIALTYHAWGASVNAIRKGSKAPLNKWKSLHDRPQEQDEVKGYAWPNAGGVGVNNGPGGWHTFDLDAVKDADGKIVQEVPQSTLLVLLETLGLPSDYAWVWRGRGGWALALRCKDTLPEGILPAAKKESGVFWGWPAKESSYGFHHVELRWARCQTVYPPSTHPSGISYQWLGADPSDPPAEVRISRIIEAFYRLCPPPPHTLSSLDNTTKATIRQRFDLVAYAQRTFGGDLKREGDEVRILGHGGLLIKPTTHEWYAHRDEIGGDCFDLIAYGKYQTRAQNLNGKSSEVLQLAAEFAGVTLPQRQPDSSTSSRRDLKPDLQSFLAQIDACENRTAVEHLVLSDEMLLVTAALERRDLLLLRRAIEAKTTQRFANEWASVVKEQRQNSETQTQPKATSEPTTPSEPLGSKDPGLIKRLADAITSDHHFARDGGRKLYIWRDGVYQADGDQHVARRVKALLELWEETQEWSSHRSDEVSVYIAIDAPSLWERPPLDIINVQNGLLNVATGVLSSHSPDHLSPIQIPVAYDPEATCAAWEQFVADVFPDDAVAAGVAWELAAWLMTPDTSIQKAVLLSGEGANGKSTFLAALIAFIGKRNTASVSLQRLEEDRFSASRLVGKLANICPDLPSTHLAETSTFKALLGGDTITVERKHVDSFDVLPFARLIFSANHPPQSKDATFAFFRRWLVIPFEKTFEGKAAIPRTEMDARLANPCELSGVLNKALAAYARVRQNGFTETPTMRAAWDEFRQTTDPLSVWLGRATLQGPDAFVSKHDLLNAYNEACDRMGASRMTGNAFGRALRRAVPDVQEVQRTVNGKRAVWCWLGIGLRSKDVDQPDDVTRNHDKSRESRDSPNCKIDPEKPVTHTSDMCVQEVGSVYSANRENRVIGVIDVTHPTDAIVKCDYRGNISPYGVYWLAILPDGTHSEPTDCREVAERALQEALHDQGET